MWIYYLYQNIQVDFQKIDDLLFHVTSGAIVISPFTFIKYFKKVSFYLKNISFGNPYRIMMWPKQT